MNDKKVWEVEVVAVYYCKSLEEAHRMQEAMGGLLYEAAQAGQVVGKGVVSVICPEEQPTAATPQVNVITSNTIN